jgi:hypothetical protein
VVGGAPEVTAAVTPAQWVLLALALTVAVGLAVWTRAWLDWRTEQRFRRAERELKRAEWDRAHAEFRRTSAGHESVTFEELVRDMVEGGADPRV